MSVVTVQTKKLNHCKFIGNSFLSEQFPHLVWSFKCKLENCLLLIVNPQHYLENVLIIASCGTSFRARLMLRNVGPLLRAERDPLAALSVRTLQTFGNDVMILHSNSN